MAREAGIHQEADARNDRERGACASAYIMGNRSFWAFECRLFFVCNKNVAKAIVFIYRPAIRAICLWCIFLVRRYIYIYIFLDKRQAITMIASEFVFFSPVTAVLLMLLYELFVNIIQQYDRFSA